MVRNVLAEELGKIRESIGQAQFALGNYEQAAKLFDEIIAADDLDEFLTIKAYKLIE